MTQTEFIQYLSQRILKGVEYNEIECKYDPIIGFNDKERAEILQVIKELGWSNNKLTAVIDELISRITYNKAKVLTISKLLSEELNNFQHILLKGRSVEFGDEELELLLIGEFKFLVLYSSRGVLRFNDVLICRQRELKVDYSAFFSLYRDGVEYPQGGNYMYRTYPLFSITLMNPSDLYLCYDTGDFSIYNEHNDDTNPAVRSLEDVKPFEIKLMHYEDGCFTESRYDRRYTLYIFEKQFETDNYYSYYLNNELSFTNMHIAVLRKLLAPVIYEGELHESISQVSIIDKGKVYLDDNENWLIKSKCRVVFKH